MRSCHIRGNCTNPATKTGCNCAAPSSHRTCSQRHLLCIGECGCHVEDLLHKVLDRLSLVVLVVLSHNSHLSLCCSFQFSSWVCGCFLANLFLEFRLLLTAEGLEIVLGFLLCLLDLCEPVPLGGGNDSIGLLL